ncbi:YjhX family toxin [Novispirillum sp. DQ9]|uniref:YjhX family toxin n=1 Tax=Novispirillum sp. DQ9 TaxID=3398612 RepID=UPI003C7E7990
MNISRSEQRVLHALARGGRIEAVRDHTRTVTEVDCISREGWVLSDCTLDIFKKLRGRRLIASREGGPYHITRQGLAAVRAQADNR